MKHNAARWYAVKSASGPMRDARTPAPFAPGDRVTHPDSPLIGEVIDCWPDTTGRLTRVLVQLGPKHRAIFSADNLTRVPEN